MVTLTNTISLLLGLVLICQPVEMMPEFQQLLRRLTRANRSMTAMETDTITQMFILEAQPPPQTPFDGPIDALDALDDMLVILDGNRQHLQQVIADTQKHINRIGKASASPAPYSSNTDLAAVLAEAQLKGQEALAKVQELAVKGDERLAEIEYDIGIKMDDIINALGGDEAVLNSLISEALDELGEAHADAHSALEEVRKNADEANRDFVLRFNDTRDVLNAIPNPDPPFTNFILRFLAA